MCVHLQNIYKLETANYLMSRSIELFAGAVTKTPQIANLKQFDSHIGIICNNLFGVLTSKQIESTYQRCLKIELEEAGLDVQEEVVLLVKYKGHQVGTRRADLVITTGDTASAVVELKAEKTLTSKHLKQLHYYMHHLQIDHGYLINFPHDTGFPEVDNSGTRPRVFNQTKILAPLTQAFPLRDPLPPRANQAVSILKVVRTPSGLSPTPFILLDPVIQPDPVIQLDPILESISSLAVWGITRQGQRCKICDKMQAFCNKHRRSSFSGSQEAILNSSK
jgi:GxxExxY protein